MVEWLFQSLDPTREHNVPFLIAWHGRAMFLAFGFLAPLAILTARFGKIWPGQKWPEELDNQNWWIIHLVCQTLIIILASLALFLTLNEISKPDAPLHRILGYSTLMLVAMQYASGLFRGTKGGPTEAKMRGDHYDMTLRRIWFEKIHKSLGYITLLLGFATIASGLWAANAPNWMALIIAIWWMFLVSCFAVLQRLGYAFDTYQAHWGTDPELAGNRREPIGWGIRRFRRDED